MSLAAPLPNPTERAAARPGSERLVPEEGRMLAGKYVLERPAGFGGMAEVWVATNQATGAEVCVKLLVPREEQADNDEEAVERFRREAHAAACLSHRAIVRVYDLLELDTRGKDISNVSSVKPHAYAIVMELLRGETLGDLLMKRDKLPLEEALDLFLPVLSALGHAHRAAVIHRDLKPDNIFLASDPDGKVIPKVLDFGVSKLESAAAITIDGVLVGTPSFMSPEQARGARQIDARSDVFSAGVLLYMMLDGRNPFDDAQNFSSTVDAILRRELPVLEGVPPQIWDVLARATAKDPAQRWHDATEMAIALRKAAGRRVTTDSYTHLPPISSGRIAITAESTGSVPQPVAPAPEVDASARRRRRTVIGVVVVCSILGVLAVAMTLLQTSLTAPPPVVAVSPPVATTAVPSPAPSSVTVTPPTPAAVVSATPAAPEPTAPPSVRTPDRPKPAPTVLPAPGRTVGKDPHIARDPGF